ncbi:exodeoxyribonuclease V subunit beta [Methylomagnum ishizawai]|uniref:exodeoxyribonuclease V subunit beta n=1 Tax=Methylomagnum ishizawai TaxID=1760988 RepID=UPI001C33F332|nr:exodeoxyribonuclease V subunit beta [Methylomagnum ishizawai]BBL75557.1 RecBCD enzyme subunit RecB [Methylomagnum ishizawai]
MAISPNPEFNVYQAELSGLTLVEASAGTGKTWTISGLYTRLILDSGLSVDQILVVTYTKAATAELQDRIRKRLRDVLAALETGDANGDEFCRAMLERHAPAQELAVRRLTRAIGGFDQAAVFTIHGFCQRLLSESAFESGSDFDCEILPNETELLREIVDDFWRCEVYPASEAWAGFLLEQKQSPDLWLGEIAGHVGKPFLKVLGAEEMADTAALEAAFHAAMRRTALAWHRDRAGIAALLLGHRGFNGKKITAAKLKLWLAEADAYLAPWPLDGMAGLPSLALPEGVGKLGAATLAACMNKGHEPPQHPFCQACQDLLNTAERLRTAYTTRLMALKPRLLRYCDEELERRKTLARLFSYNDLLNRLATALDAEQGERLAATIRRRYQAALIDEFQDTDPVQYRIFRRVYGDGGQPVFFVGDPKQAIYGFRGADVFSYLEARRAGNIRRGTLMHNQRSEPGLIRAVNALFLGRERPFLLDDIPYPAVAPAHRARDPLQIAGDGGEPLRFLMLPAEQDEDGAPVPLGKGAAASLAAEGAAHAIARLLRGAAAGHNRLGGRPLDGGDIAVLVATHHQARQVEAALRLCGVPSVRQGQDNVFESGEALELERVLRAIASPGRESLMKAALATELMGYSANAIHRLQQDEPGWEKLFERFQTYHQLWLREGFMPMFRRWFEEAGVTRNLPDYRDGERRLTNLLHLAELLQVESRRKAGIDTLLTWFGHTLRQAAKADEAAQLRLESDAQRVKIVTVHTSKGLEYPIVFCPFAWDGRLMQRLATAILFHDGCEPVLDLGSPQIETHRAQAVLEEMSEKLRLLYVALTRAIYRCYVVWGDVRNGRDPGEGLHTTALGWLLHGNPEIDAAADPAAALEQRLAQGGHPLILGDVQAFAAKLDGGASVDPLDRVPSSYRAADIDPAPELAARGFSRTGLYPSWRMSSFTGLATGRHSEDPDYDLSAEPDTEDEEAAGDSMFAFPRGAKAGTCLHAILEDWDFTHPDGDKLGELVKRKLKAHGLDEAWTATVRKNIETLLATPLNKEGVLLGAIPPEKRLVEMEFTYTIRGGAARRFQQLLENPEHGCDPRFAQAARHLDFKHIEGYMKGFIDLVFEAGGRYYLADYKSNWLGNAYAKYAPARLGAAIARDHYYLQYLIYTVALHRYLGQRLPGYDYGRDFGGVFYLFLRGIKPGQKTGIYWDRPGLALVEGLSGVIG